MALGANAEGEEERSLRDDLAKGLAEIEAREASEATAAPEGDDAPAPEAQADEQPAEPKSDRGDGRDAHGRFIRKTETAEGSAAPTGDTPQTGSKDDGQAADAQQPSPTDPAQSQQTEDQPPKSWRADEAQAWKDLPATAKSAILRREAEAARLAGANDAERMFGREMADLFRPYVPEIQAAGANPQMALKTLLDNHNALRSNDPNVKLGTARRLLAQYGIDPAQVAEPDPNAPPPHVVQLQAEIERLKQQISAPQGQQFAPLPPTPEEGNILSEIEAFRADPAHPHFDAVRSTMGRLLETEAATSLQQAYLMAVAADPALRSTVADLAPQRTQEDKTAAARRAAASVTGSPGATGTPRPMSLRDELAEGLRSAGFSV